MKLDLIAKNKKEELINTILKSGDIYRHTYLNSKSAIMILTKENGFLACNKSTVDLFGCRDEADFISNNPASLSPEFQPDGSRSDDKSLEMMNLAQKNGSHLFEWVHKKVSGVEFQASVLLSWIKVGDLGILEATVRDISDFKKVEKEKEEIRIATFNILEDISKDKIQIEEEEEKLRILMNNLPIGVILEKVPGREIISINPRGIELFDCILDFKQKIKFVDTHSFFKEDETIYPEKELPFFLSLKDGKIIKKDDIFLKHSSGIKINISITAVPVKGINGKINYVVVIVDDITKIKELDRIKTEFILLVSHQLRTPLSVVNWYSEMISDGDAGEINEKQKEYIKEIIAAGKRMSALVNTFLDISRIEMGTYMKTFELLQISKIVEDILSDLNLKIKEKKINFTLNIDKEMSEIKTNKRFLNIIFDNLISNAIKYTPDGGSVDVSVFKKDKFLRIEVKDTGYGIPKNQQSKIFTKLFRADNVKLKEVGGTGVGLYLTKTIINYFKGTIEFSSEENKGSTFVVMIPL